MEKTKKIHNKNRLLTHVRKFAKQGYINTNTQSLTTSKKPKIGDHLVTPRTGYTHHGIYIGNGKVIHYSGLAEGLSAGPIEEVTLKAFSNGRGFAIKSYESPAFSGQAVVERAKSRLGENQYNVLSNNCEHFCEWCINDIHSSGQVNRTRALAATTMAGFTALRFISPPPVAAALSLGYGAYCLHKKMVSPLPEPVSMVTPPESMSEESTDK